MVDIEKQTWSNMKQGLMEIGQAVRIMPVLCKDCKDIKADLSKLEKISEILIHPFTLIFHAGQRLLLNGVDIFKKLNLSRQAYKNGDFYNMGKWLGEALDETLLKSPMVKKPVDESSFFFLNGFFTGLQVKINPEKVYNGVNGIGSMIYGPVGYTMKMYNEADGELNQRVLMGLHEVSHSFLEGGQVLVAKKALTA